MQRPTLSTSRQLGRVISCFMKRPPLCIKQYYDDRPRRHHTNPWDLDRPPYPYWRILGPPPSPYPIGGDWVALPSPIPILVDNRCPPIPIPYWQILGVPPPPPHTRTGRDWVSLRGPPPPLEGYMQRGKASLILQLPFTFCVHR